MMVFFRTRQGKIFTWQKFSERWEFDLKTGFQIALLGRLILTSSCLLMHSILVQINGLKYNFRKQKSIWLVKMFE